MDCHTSGFLIIHHLLEFSQTLVHWVRYAIQSFHPVILLSYCLQSFPASGYFPMSQLFPSGGKRIRSSASLLPVNIQVLFPLECTGLISLLSKGLSRVFSSTTVQRINSSVFSLLYGSTLISLDDYWKNHRIDYMGLCWESNVSV